VEGHGLAFAIPISAALKVATKLLQLGKIAYGTIGVAGAELDLPAQVVSKHGLKQATALLVMEIDPDGPAKKAGIHVGDWLLAIDNQRVDSLGTFLDILDGDLIGKTVTLQVLRGSDFALAEKRVKVVKLELEEV
jgi:serine protease DegS